ncbi:GatB/YqeY domain-containing protein [candidate division KSB1 bacterium]|nr:GatB/YqeY domain-containing protein [candidate division KSB1 bacterium]
MSLLNRLTDDMKTAMKAGEKDKLSTIRLLRGQLKDAEIDKREALTEEEEIMVLTSAAKKRRESIQAYQDAGREELAAREQMELDIIQTYLPAQLDAVEVENIIDQIIAETGAETIKDLGKVMPVVMGRTRGCADGKLVSEMVRKKLSL